MLGLLPTLAILVVLGLWAIIMFYRLGRNIDVILARELHEHPGGRRNEGSDRSGWTSGFFFAVGGRDRHGREQFDANRPRFLEHLKVEQGNITLAGEGELAETVDGCSSSMSSTPSSFSRSRGAVERRAELYFRRAAADIRDDQAGRRSRSWRSIGTT